MVLVLDGKTDLNQISLTGVRAITLLGLLAVAPRSMEEIRQAFLDLKIMDVSHSDDILRIDINTLKSFGCEISRSSAKTGFKYVLEKYPFAFPIDSDDIKILRQFFDKVKNSLDISKLIECDKLLYKISERILDADLKEKFLGISPLKRYDIEMVKELAAACANKYTLKLMYKKQYEQEPAEKEIVAQKLVFVNDKLYLYGYDFEKQDSVTLLFRRIKSIISKRLTDKEFEQKKFVVKFEITEFAENVLNENEKIVKKEGNSCLVEGSYFNEFLAVQRILSLGSQCMVKEPAKTRAAIISKLKEIKRLYD